MYCDNSTPAGISLLTGIILAIGFISGYGEIVFKIVFSVLILAAIGVVSFWIVFFIVYYFRNKNIKEQNE